MSEAWSEYDSSDKTTNKEMKTLAYNTLVKPQVEYASSVWSPYTKENINKIEMLQRRAARWVTNDFSPYSSVTDLGGGHLSLVVTMHA